MKLSAPKRIRHSSDAPRPIREEMWFFSRSQLSRKITVNIAVIMKSRPDRSNGISEPKIPPRAAPVTQ